MHILPKRIAVLIMLVGIEGRGALLHDGGCLGLEENAVPVIEEVIGEMMKRSR